MKWNDEKDMDRIQWFSTKKIGLIIVVTFDGMSKWDSNCCKGDIAGNMA